MSTIRTAPMSGTRDFLPADVLKRNYVISIIERVYQSYGFEPLITPALERLDTLLGKYGEEGDQLIFRVLKRGDELRRALEVSGSDADTLSDAGLRYDLTVPLARVVAEHRHRLPRIFKRYQIQPVYRADRPAKGRFREFYQCDVDVVGSGSQAVEAEVINAVSQVLVELGFGDEGKFAVRLNHRGVLRGLIEVAGVSPEMEASALVAIDKLDKVGPDGVRDDMIRRGLSSESAASLLSLATHTSAGNGESLETLADALAQSEPGRKGVAELRRVVTFASYGPAASRIRVDPSLARGLSYYTGPIFEIEFPGFNGSGGGGGRYDDLIGMFSGQRIPASGFSMGLERILLLMDEQGLFPDRLAGEPQVLVTQYDETTAGASFSLAQLLRSADLRVDLYPDFDGYGRQFKYADQRRIRYALLVGPREVEASVVAAKDLSTGAQIDVGTDDVAAWLRERL